MDASRRRFLVVSGLASVAGCVGNNGREAVTGPPTTDFTVPVPYELEEVFDHIFLGFGDRDPADPSIDVSDRDVAIDEPSFVAAGDVTLGESDVVFGLELRGEAKAYPQEILVWHEVVNDVVGGEPVSVTYCPLTGSAVGFERGNSSFGVSNQLVNSNLILYDRGTETWWPQILGAGIANDLRGHALVETNVVWTTWDRWRARHEDTLVLSEETGFIRKYGDDPYGSYGPEPTGYYASTVPAREQMHEDDRLHRKEVVVGSRSRDGAVAFVKETLRELKTEDRRVGDTRYSAFYDERLDVVYVYRNDLEASFAYEDGAFVNEQADRFGATDIPLERQIAFDVMWFAWFAFYPNTQVGSTEPTFFD